MALDLDLALEVSTLIDLDLAQDLEKGKDLARLLSAMRTTT